jgi:hypothetical protein
VYGDAVHYALTIRPSWMSIDSLTGMISGIPSGLNARDTVLAPVNHTVDVAVQILSSRYNQNWNTYNHTAITNDGCMVSFFQKVKIEPMQQVRITAKVKAHGRMYHRPDLAETRLNYVKIVNDHKTK